MNDTLSLSLRFFAASVCHGRGHHRPEDYLAHYGTFVWLLGERRKTAEPAVPSGETDNANSA